MSDRKTKRLEQENAQLREENRLLRQKIDALSRRLFGVKSEALNPAQMQLLLDTMEHDDSGPEEAPAPEPCAEVVEAPKARPRRPRVPEHLAVVEEVLDPEAVTACPEAWRYIGEEVSEQIDYEPGRFFCRRTVRRKYVKRSSPEQPPVIAPLPARILERGLMAPGLLAHVVISKYADHLPLYRQEQIYRERHGLDLPRQTLCRAVWQVADWLKPIVREMGTAQLAGGYLQVDETPIKYLDPGAGKTAQGYLWTAHVPAGDTVYHWYPGRGHDCLMDFVADEFEGVMQCDGYSAYRTFAGKRKGIELAGCWAHARRKFFEALQGKDSPEHAGCVLGRIGELYGIEKRLRDTRAGPEERRRVRQAQSRPIVENIFRTLSEYSNTNAHLPQSLMGKAVSYALGQQSVLQLWLEEGRVEIDNNLVENAIRPTAIGKKNWLFIGAKEAGWCAAVIYSIITSCRTRGINPHTYLTDVLERLPSMTNHQIPDITPAAWAADRAHIALKAS